MYQDHTEVGHYIRNYGGVIEDIGIYFVLPRHTRSTQPEMHHCAPPRPDHLSAWAHHQTPQLERLLAADYSRTDVCRN